jgi:Protein of unknown function (DUF2911)
MPGPATESASACGGDQILLGSATPKTGVGYKAGGLMFRKPVFTIPFAFIVCTFSFSQQDTNKMPGEAAQAQCRLSEEEAITVEYSKAHTGGRRIFGGVVPYGGVWRTGVDGASTFVTDEDLVTVKGTNIPTGGYTFLIIPNPDKWTLIINKNTVYDSGEIARVPMSVKKLSAPVENFTISFDTNGTSCTMHISWENLQGSLEFAKRNTDLPLRADEPVPRQK